MKIVFMGTPEFAIPSLQAIWESEHEVVAVVSVPDKPVGRGLKIKPSPVKQLAMDYNIPVLQPEKLNDDLFAEQLQAFKADLFVVVAFRILPEKIFSIPPLGTVNLHASLLPKYRGAAPINWAIIRGETETGVTIFFIQKQVDTGNILLQEKEEISPEDNAGDVHDKLMNLGAEVLLEAIDLIEAGEAPSMMQTGEVTSAPKITREMCQIQWNQPTQAIHNLIRGLCPAPGAFSYLDDKLIKIFSSKIIGQDGVPQEPPGTIIDLNHKQGLIAIATGDGVLAIEEVQLAGKRCMCAAEFLKGSRIKIGDHLV